MWNEASPEIAQSSLKREKDNHGPFPAEVDSVEPGSIGEDIGLQPGDKVLSINGVKPRDLIDYRYLIIEEELHLEVIDQNGALHEVDLEKDSDDGLGISFTEALFDGLKQCNNACPFCFIDQQPQGKRNTLYLKDDDYRMSFLYGSYLTLTNLSKVDWERIEAQRLSPLFVSIHSTDPKLRAKLLRNPRAGIIVDQIKWFQERRLQFHAQIVVCPGLNDGKALSKTINDLFLYAQGDWPVVLSTAIVPVGLTRFRPNNDGLAPVDKECASNVINEVEKLQKIFYKKNHSRFAWLSDEWYLIAGKTLPKRKEYEDLPQESNGVGSIRFFLEEMEQATFSLPKKIDRPRCCSWVVGKLVANALNKSVQRLNEIEGLSLMIYGLPSPYWGTEEVVTGLLTGQDLIEGLKGQKLGEELLIPAVMLKQGQRILLDDMSIEQVAEALKVNIKIVNGASDIVDNVLGIASKPSEII